MVGVGSLAVPGAKTPTTGNTLPALVAGQPPLLVLEPDPVYHRRIPGFQPNTSSRLTPGNCFNIVPSFRLTTPSPATLLQPTNIVLVIGSIQLPFPEQLV